jgi:triosephosphate isomerase
LTDQTQNRRPILAANWKMQKSAGEAAQFLEVFLPLVASASHADVVIAPPFTALDRASQALAGSGVRLAAQNVNAEEKGAFTGEIAPSMLSDLGCQYGIVGHSERRALYGESSEIVSQKAAALLRHNIRPIVCVGETLDDREAGRTNDLIGEQLTGSLKDVPDDRTQDLVIAYEPVWAIGTGRTATPEIAQETHAFIRKALIGRFGPSAGNSIRIQYGGSVKPENVQELMANPDIDGALVGGASLDPESFSKIVFFDSQETSA